MHFNKSIITICLVFVLVSGIAHNLIKKHIDGNVLHLPLLNQVYEGLLPLPWVGNSIVSSLLFRTLLLPDSSLTQFSPDLASKYSISDDGLVYRFVMKENQKWSDGMPITPEDVVFSIEAALHTGFINYLYINTFKKIDYMEIDDNVLTIKLNERHANFIPVLAQFAIMPKHKLEDKDIALLYMDNFWKNPTVSGMYKVGDIRTNQYFKLIRNEYYSGKKPKIDEVMVYIDNTNNKLDYYHTNNISEMVNFRAMRGFTEHQIDMLYYRYIMFNIEGNDGFKNSAMQDLRVREAIAYAIDKNKLLYDIYYNVGNVVGNVYTLEEQELHKLEVERAKKLLKEAKYDFSRPLRIIHQYTDDTSLYLIQRITEDLEKIGFKVEARMATGGNSELYSRRNYDILIKDLAAFDTTEWYLEYDSSNILVRRILGGNGEFDKLLYELLATTNLQRYDEIMGEMSLLGRELIYKVPLFILNQSLYINTERVQLPKNYVFGNSWYHFDLDFANWEIKKQ